MSPRLPIAVFLLLCAAQVGLPGWKIQQRLDLERRAPSFLCRTRPVDPVDPLRGRYVALDLEGLRELSLPALPEGREPSGRGRAYLSFSEGADGFARYALSHELPEGESWIRVSYRRDGDGVSVLTHSLPFLRYYLEESQAPLAEQAYREAAATSQAWIALRVRRGEAALEELFVDGQPIGDWLRDHAPGIKAPESVAPALEPLPDLPEESEEREGEGNPRPLEEPLVGGKQDE